MQTSHDRMEELVDRYGARIFRCAYFYLGDHGWAEDACQQVLLKVYENLDRLDAVDSPEGWIMRVSINLCKNILKSRQFRHQRQERLLEDGIPWGQAMETTVEQREEYAMIVEEIRQLPARYRDAVVLKYLNGYSTQETAQVLGIQPVSVRSRLSRASAMLRRRLEGRVDLGE